MGIPSILNLLRFKLEEITTQPELDPNSAPEPDPEPIPNIEPDLEPEPDPEPDPETEVDWLPLYQARVYFN